MLALTSKNYGSNIASIASQVIENALDLVKHFEGDSIELFGAIN